MSDEDKKQEQDPTTNEAGKQEEKAPEPKGLSEEEVNRRIEEARKQEKDKLYGKIEKLEGNLTTLTELAEAERKAKEDAEAKARAAAEEERQKGLSENEKSAERLRAVEERLAEEARQREELQQALEDEKLQRELEAYRHQVLSEAGDEIIPELVTGNSKEAIEQNAAIAKDKYKQLFDAALEKAKGEAGQAVRDGMPGSTNPDPDAMDEQGLNLNLSSLEPGKRAKNGISEDYVKNRDQILDEVARAYGR